MKRVSDILSRKGSHVISVTPDTNVFDALQLMADQNIGSVAVMNGSNFLGIMTERDYSRKVVLKGRSSSDTLVEDIMSTDLPYVTSLDTIEHCMQLLSNRHIRYLPVFDGEEISGIISINDVVTEVILSQKETISHLTEYLHSNL
jgi:CBS domain-containing protein